MSWINKTPIMRYNAKIFRVLDGNTRETDNTAKNVLWMPAFAGMTIDVGGTSR